MRTQKSLRMRWRGRCGNWQRKPISHRRSWTRCVTNFTISRFERRYLISCFSSHSHKPYFLVLLAGETRKNALPRSRVEHGRQAARRRIRQRGGGGQDARQEDHGQEIEEARRTRGEGNQSIYPYPNRFPLEKRSTFSNPDLFALQAERDFERRIAARHSEL